MKKLKQRVVVLSLVFSLMISHFVPVAVYADETDVSEPAAIEEIVNAAEEEKEEPALEEVEELAEADAEEEKKLSDEAVKPLEKKAEKAEEKVDRKSTRLNSSHPTTSRMPSSA